MESMSWLMYSTSVLAIAVGFFYAYAKYKLSYWSRRGVKTPPTHLIFGNFKESIIFKKPPMEQMCNIYDSADPDDPYIGFYIFHKPMLLLRDHELIKHMMIRNFDIFPNRRFGSSTGTDTMGLCNLLAITSQPIWKYLRTKLTPALSGQRLKTMMPLLMQCTDPMLKYIDGLPENNEGWKQSQDTLEILSRHMSNVLTSVLYGIDENAFEPKENGFFEAVLNVFRGFSRALVFLIYFFIPGLVPVIQPFVTWPSKYFRKYFNESMKHREQTGIKRGDFVDFLIMLKNGKQNPIFNFEGDNLLGQVVGFHIAGFESTGTSTAWAIHDLARHPEHQQTLYEEINKYLSGKELTVELINELPFLDEVVNEALRLHPPLPVIDRIAEKDIEVPGTGLIIEKGVSIYVSINSINQDTRYFNKPRNFIPTREKTDNKKFYESLVFGVGPRACVGQRLALVMIKTAIIALISNYTWVCTKQEESDTDVAVHFFNYAADGLNVNFKKRKQEL